MLLQLNLYPIASDIPLTNEIVQIVMTLFYALKNPSWPQMTPTHETEAVLALQCPLSWPVLKRRPRSPEN